jgi:hypothetical protein
MLALAGFSLAVIDMRSAEAVIPVLLLLMAFLYWKVFPENPQTVSISPTTVKADYGTGRVISDLLRNYVLHIDTFSGRTVSSYTYTVSLKPKSGHARHATRVMTGHRFGRTAVITGTIPLCTRILTPENLREWVLAFQEQLELPLDMLFESEQTMEEYRQGKFLKH